MIEDIFKPLNPSSARGVIKDGRQKSYYYILKRGIEVLVVIDEMEFLQVQISLMRY